MMDQMSIVARADGLFAPVSLGELTLSNRVVMSPMTRRRAGPGDTAGHLQAEYYAQRAEAGLLIAESAQVSPQGRDAAGTPGIHSAAQVAGWRLTTDAVHARGGRIMLQLWHVGRVAHPLLRPDGALPVGPSAIAAPGMAETPDGPRPYPVPQALSPAGIADVVAQFRAAAANARAAGFDGIELHAGNGFLLDQFLRASSNRRTDAYGGSIANRLRLLLEVTEAVCEVWPAGRVGVRISPINPWGGMQDSDPAALFGAAAAALSVRNIAYLHVAEARTRRPMFGWSRLRDRFGGAYIANGGFDRYCAEAALSSGRADLISFGRAFIANPDLVQRLRLGVALRPADPAVYYGGGAVGYTDYPSLSLQQRMMRPAYDWRRAALARLHWW